LKSLHRSCMVLRDLDQIDLFTMERRCSCTGAIIGRDATYLRLLMSDNFIHRKVNTNEKD
jgi:hypothetical protein